MESVHEKYRHALRQYVAIVLHNYYCIQPLSTPHGGGNPGVDEFARRFDIDPPCEFHIQQQTQQGEKIYVADDGKLWISPGC